MSTGASNYLVVDNGFYTNSGNFLVGAGLGAKFNSIVITNGGKFLTGGGTVSAIGMAGSLSNSMAVIGGAGGVSMVNAISHAINLLGSNSTLLVDGQGVADSAIVTNAGMTVGAAAAQNQNGVTIRNGGRIFTGGAAVIGTLGSGNYVRVEGGAVTSLWNAGNSAVTVGSGATAQNNTLAIDGKGITGAAAVTNTAALIVGSSSSYNSLLITNGGLLALNSTLNISIDGTSNRLDIVGNASAKSVLNAGNFAITVGNNNGTNNMLLVDGQGTVGAAVITNSAALSFGASTNGTRGNIIRFANGGVGYISSATIAAPVSGLGASVNCPAYDNVFEILDGARVYSAGMVAVAYSQKANTHPFARNRLLVRGSESFLALNGSALMVGGDVTGGAGISNNECRIDAGLVTNVGAVQIAYNISADPVINGNSLIITNGGRLYSSAASIVSTTTPSTGNVITVTGAGSIWNLGTQSLTIGYATTSSSNLLVIDQGGLVDSIATLSVLTNNAVKLQGGTLGVTTWTLNNGLLFTVGDGTQAATLKSLAGGTLSFNKGLLITSNAVLAGVGTVSGGATGVILTNGASLAPGSSGIGTLTIGGSNLTWNAGATYIVGISNFAGNAGVAYDTLNVSSQLTLVANAGSSSLVIRVSSMGTLAANFSANASYNLLVASNAVLTGFDPTKFTVNTNDFLNPSAGTWGVMSLNNGLYVTYSPSAETSLAYTWAAPTNGNWTVGGNW
ncbi:MAG: hypothetical protein WCL16_13405, partial [bacterium]